MCATTRDGCNITLGNAAGYNSVSLQLCHNTYIYSVCHGNHKKTIKFYQSFNTEVFCLKK